MPKGIYIRKEGRKYGMSGHTHSFETKIKIGKGNKDKEVSELQRLHYRIAKIGNKKPMFGKKGVLCPSYGLKRTEETKLKLKEARIKRVERDGYFNSPITREKQRIARLKQKIPFRDTSIEIKMQNELNKRNIIFKKQKPLLNRFIVDLFIKPNIVIECDGDYWHNRSEVIKRDKIKNKELKKNKFHLYRFWEHEINRSPEECINKITQLKENENTD